jgi:hypothetical protein
MNKPTYKLLVIMVVAAVISLFTNIHSKAELVLSKTNELPAEAFTVTLVPAENGSYTINPKIPADGKVQAGTILTVTAKPASDLQPGCDLLHSKGRHVGNYELRKFFA